MWTTDGQTDGPMDQSFTLTWFLTTAQAFYEASVVTKFGGETGGHGPPPAPPLATALIISSILYFNVSLVVAVV